MIFFLSLPISEYIFEIKFFILWEKKHLALMTFLNNITMEVWFLVPKKADFMWGFEEFFRKYRTINAILVKWGKGSVGGWEF